MSLRRWLAGQTADQGRREFRIGSGRFSLIARNLSSCRSRASAIKSIGMQPCHIHGLPQRQPAASHSQPQQAILGSAGLPGQLLQRLQGVRRICNSTHSGATVLWQGRSFSSCCRVGSPFSTYSSRPLGFSSFHTAPHHGSQQSGLQQQLHRGQPQGMAELRAAFTSDAATQRGAPASALEGYFPAQTGLAPQQCIFICSGSGQGGLWRQRLCPVTAASRSDQACRHIQ